MVNTKKYYHKAKEVIINNMSKINRYKNINDS